MIAAVALGALVAFTAPAQAGPPGPGDAPRKPTFRDRFPGVPGPRRSGGIKKVSGPVVVKHASAKCESYAYSGSFSLAKNAHAHYIAEAWKYSCSDKYKNLDEYWQYIYKNVKDSKTDTSYGRAFALATTAAYASCDTKGNAYGCASAYAFAEAWAKAVATAHAEAWAEGINYCECNNKYQIAQANSDAYASESKWFSAYQYSVSEASACGEYGYDDYPDYQAQTCVQDIYFVSIAKAVAHAAIDGHCLHKSVWNYDEPPTDITYSEYTADAKTEATATIVQLAEYKGCEDYVTYLDSYH